MINGGTNYRIVFKEVLSSPSDRERASPSDVPRQNLRPRRINFHLCAIGFVPGYIQAKLRKQKRDESLSFSPQRSKSRYNDLFYIRIAQSDCIIVQELRLSGRDLILPIWILPVELWCVGVPSVKTLSARFTGEVCTCHLHKPVRVSSKINAPDNERYICRDDPGTLIGAPVNN